MSRSLKENLIARVGECPPAHIPSLRIQVVDRLVTLLLALRDKQEPTTEIEIAISTLPDELKIMIKARTLGRTLSIPQLYTISQTHCTHFGTVSQPWYPVDAELDCDRAGDGDNEEMRRVILLRLAEGCNLDFQAQAILNSAMKDFITDTWNNAQRWQERYDPHRDRNTLHRSAG